MKQFKHWHWIKKMKENYWFREGLTKEDFRKQTHDLEQQQEEQAEHKLNQQQQQQQEDASGQRHWHQQNKITSTTTQIITITTAKTETKINRDYNSNLGHAEVLIVAESSDEDEDEGGRRCDKNQGEIAGNSGHWAEGFLGGGLTAPVRDQERLQTEGQQQEAKNDEKDFNLSFCGCGFLGIYHVGVASCFHQYAPQLSMHKISGSSAGSLVAVTHLCGNLQLAFATTEILRVAIEARARTLGPLHPSFDINVLVRDALERGLPDDVHLRVSGKLHISLTRVYDGENVIISEFESKEEVIQALLCSCFIPFWSGLVTPKFRGIRYMDGGFSKNLLVLDDKTVTVSPFAGEADICPRDDSLNLLQVSLSNTSFSISPNNLYRLSHALLPPPPEVLSELCEQGFADGIRFLQQMKLISCTKCVEIRSSLLVTVVSTTSQIYQQATSSRSTSTPCRGIDGYSDSEPEDIENCNECFLMRQRALYDPLPTQFSDRIRDACDAVNKSLSNWIYSYRPIKYLSYLAAPYYLPFDILLALILKFWQELPLIRSELLSCVANIVDLLTGIVRHSL